MDYMNTNTNWQQNGLEYLDALTILSVILQLSDHEKTMGQDVEINKIQKDLEEINNKLDYIIRRLDYGSGEGFNS